MLGRGFADERDHLISEAWFAVGAALRRDERRSSRAISALGSARAQESRRKAAPTVLKAGSTSEISVPIRVIVVQLHSFWLSSRLPALYPHCSTDGSRCSTSLLARLVSSRVAFGRSCLDDVVSRRFSRGNDGGHEMRSRSYVRVAAVAMRGGERGNAGRLHPAGWMFVPFLSYALINVFWITPVRWLGWFDWLGWGFKWSEYFGSRSTV